MRYEELISAAYDMGFSGAEIIAVQDIVLNAEFRAACEANRCGVYGKCWTCPPYVGEIDVLMERIRGFSHALLYQLVTPLEDSYDFEGMIEAGRAHSEKGRKLWKQLRPLLPADSLHLSAGGCRVCKKCAKLDEEPCRFPEEATASLEAYGVSVSETVAKTKMKYINGANTVTYFGVILFRENDYANTDGNTERNK